MNTKSRRFGFIDAGINQATRSRTAEIVDGMSAIINVRLLYNQVEKAELWKGDWYRFAFGFLIIF
jgi:undecaprenyl pyrophosphate phosphatase UppP